MKRQPVARPHQRLRSLCQVRACRVCPHAHHLVRGRLARAPTPTCCHALASRGPLWAGGGPVPVVWDGLNRGCPALKGTPGTLDAALRLARTTPAPLGQSRTEVAAGGGGGGVLGHPPRTTESSEGVLDPRTTSGEKLRAALPKPGRHPPPRASATARRINGRGKCPQGGPCHAGGAPSAPAPAAPSPPQRDKALLAGGRARWHLPGGRGQTRRWRAWGRGWRASRGCDGPDPHAFRLAGARPRLRQAPGNGGGPLGARRGCPGVQGAAPNRGQATAGHPRSAPGSHRRPGRQTSGREHLGAAFVSGLRPQAQPRR